MLSNFRITHSYLVLIKDNVTMARTYLQKDSKGDNFVVSHYYVELICMRKELGLSSQGTFAPAPHSPDSEWVYFQEAMQS